MTEVVDHGHSFISHPSTMVATYGAGREHKGHGVLIWFAEGAIQIKSRLTLAGLPLEIFPIRG